MKMKKILAFLLAVVMCLSMCACGGGKKNLMDDAELVSGLRSKIWAKANLDLQKELLIVALEGKSYIAMEPVMKSIEETETDNYCAIGELRIDLKDKQTGGFISEYIPFTAYLSENNGEFTCDKLELEISEDSLFSN